MLRVPDNITGVVARVNGPAVASTRRSGIFGSLDGMGPLTLLPGRILTATCLHELSDGQLWVCADNFGADRTGLGRSFDAEAYRIPSEEVSCLAVLALLSVRARVARCARAHGRASRK